MASNTEQSHFLHSTECQECASCTSCQVAAALEVRQTWPTTLLGRPSTTSACDLLAGTNGVDTRASSVPLMIPCSLRSRRRQFDFNLRHQSSAPLLSFGASSSWQLRGPPKPCAVPPRKPQAPVRRLRDPQKAGPAVLVFADPRQSHHT